VHRLIVADPRRTATAEKADLFLQLKPGSDLALLNGMLRVLLDAGRLDDRFIAEFTQGWEEMPAFLEDYPASRVAEITGVPEADLCRAAEWIETAGPSWMSCWTMGLNQSPRGTWNTNALINLHLATGSICRTGSGPFSLTGQPNAMGGREMGYMVNSQRDLTLLRPAAAPPGQALPDWQIIARVACELGFSAAFSYTSAEEIFEEIKQAWNPATGYDLRGVTYARLRAAPVQWPAPPADGSGDGRSAIRYLNDGVSQSLGITASGARPRLWFPTASGRAVFFARPHLPAEEMPDQQFPYILNTGRLEHQWHTLTKTGRVARLNRLNPGPFVEIHPEDARTLGIRDGQLMQVASRRGMAVLPAAVTDRVQAGNCFVPFHWNDNYGENLAVNAVTSDAVDPISLQPGFKACAVSLSPAQDA
jgi:anaerobic selenocysteine-containing dehydrogenase